MADKIKELRDAMVVVARSIPSKGDPVWLEYRLNNRGRTTCGVLHDLRDSLAKRKRTLGMAAQQSEEVFTARAAVS